MKTTIVNYLMRNLFALVTIVLLSLVLYVQSTNASYTTESRTTAQGEVYTVSTTCNTPTYTEQVTARVDVTYILNKLTRQEANYLRQFFNAEASCGEYPTHTSTVTRQGPEQCETVTSAFCGDGSINQAYEECDGQYYCDSSCKIISQKPIEKPVYAPENNYQVIIPTGANIFNNMNYSLFH